MLKFKIQNFWFSLTKQLSEEEKLWDSLANNQCPNCKTVRQIVVTAEGGVALNVQCLQCKAKYWMAPVRELGASRIEEGDRNA
jgi:hypothetical protein